MNVEPLHGKVINKPLLLLLLLLSAFAGLLWSHCGRKVSLSGRLKKKRGVPGERKKKKKCEREKRKGTFSSLPHPLSLSPPPLTLGCLSCRLQ